MVATFSALLLSTEITITTTVCEESSIITPVLNGKLIHMIVEERKKNFEWSEIIINKALSNYYHLNKFCYFSDFNMYLKKK